MQFLGTGRIFNLGVGNASEIGLGVANKFYVYDATVGAVRFTIDTSGTVGILRSVTVGGTLTEHRFVLRTTGLTSPGDYVAGIANTNNTIGDKAIFIGVGLNGADTSSTLFSFWDAGVNSLQGSIMRNGAAAVAYNTTSDERLKEHFRPTAIGIETLMQIEVEDFNFKAEPNRDIQGFRAQALHKKYPVAVSVGGDDPKTNPWGVDYGRLTPLLAKCIQQQQMMIESLTNRLAVLEGRA